jgi:hypothetical protein
MSHSIWAGFPLMEAMERIRSRCPELPGIIVRLFVTTLLKTPGHSPADTVAAAPILKQLQAPGGAAQVTQQLLDVRRKDPPAQL